MKERGRNINKRLGKKAEGWSGHGPRYEGILIRPI
jgi:hypothetical protein